MCAPDTCALQTPLQHVRSSVVPRPSAASDPIEPCDSPTPVHVALHTEREACHGDPSVHLPLRLHQGPTHKCVKPSAAPHVAEPPRKLRKTSAAALPRACEPETIWGIAYSLRECVVPKASPRCVALSGGKDLAVDMPKFGHITFDTIPVSQQVDSWDSLPIPAPSLLPCRILHDKGVWAVTQWVRNGASVCDMLRISLPHILAEHCADIQVNGSKAIAYSVPSDPKGFCIRACFREFARVVTADILGTGRICMVDATWTVGDLLALVAGDAKVLCSQLVAQQDGVLAHPAEFVLARSGTSFQVSISPALMPLPALPVQMCNMPQLPFPPICSDASKPAGEAHIRLAIRHPVWTTVRTCAVRDDTHLSVAIRLLLPDIAATMDILPVVNGFVCNPELALRATCELTFQSHKPYPRAAIIAIPCVGNPAPDKDTTLVKRWVRSPFHQSFLTMEDGKRIDPRTRVECTQPEKVLDFRACPVKGGAKQPPKSDDIRKVVTKALADRGVPQPALPARVACVLSNVDPAHLRTRLHEPSHDFWSSLKKLASDAKIRLIIPTELKEWQQTLRKRKQSEGLAGVQQLPC